MRSGEVHSDIGSTVEISRHLLVAGSRRASLRLTRAVKGSCSVGALPGDAGIGRAGNSGGERRRLGDNEKKRRSGRALGRDGNGDDVSDFAAAATAGQRENGQECRC